MPFSQRRQMSSDAAANRHTASRKVSSDESGNVGLADHVSGQCPEWFDATHGYREAADTRVRGAVGVGDAHIADAELPRKAHARPVAGSRPLRTCVRHLIRTERREPGSQKLAPWRGRRLGEGSQQRTRRLPTEGLLVTPSSRHSQQVPW